MDKAAAESREAITRALSSGKDEDKTLALGKLLPELLSSNPQAAARSVESLETWAWREEALHLVARTWALTNPESAASWAATLGNDAERNTTLSDVGIEIARTDPGRALGLVMKHGMDDPANVTFLHLTQLWAAKDPEAVTTWIEMQPDIGFRDQGYSRVAIVKAATNPAEAASFAVDRISPGDVREETTIAVLHQWLPQDSLAAQAWVEGFPDGTIKIRAWEEIEGFRSYQAAEK